MHHRRSDSLTRTFQRRLCITERSALNLGFDEWGKFLGGSSLVAALVSRLLQNCKTIMFPKQAIKLRNPELGLPKRAERPGILDAA